MTDDLKMAIAVQQICERLDDDIHYDYPQAVPDLRKLFAAEMVEKVKAVRAAWTKLRESNFHDSETYEDMNEAVESLSKGETK